MFTGKVHERRLVTQSFLGSSSPPETGPHTLRLRNCGADMLERVSVTRLSRWNLEGSSGYGLLTVIGNTLPETNMAPENNPLEKDIPIGNHHF